MLVYRSHGRPYPEAPRIDELPDGKPEDTGDSNRNDHDARGRFKPGNRESVKGGRRKAGAIKRARRLGLSDVSSEAFAPYRGAF